MGRRESERYARELLAIQTALNNDAVTMLEPVLRLWEPVYTADMENPSTALTKVFESLKAKYTSPAALEVFHNTAARFVQSTSKASRERFIAAAGDVMGVDYGAMMRIEGLALNTLEDRAVSWNASLITKMTDDQRAKIEQVVWTEVTQKTSPGGIIAQLQGKAPGPDGTVSVMVESENRARLIARDQTAKLNADINQVRQQALGITEYRWVTSKDDRVRPTHEANDGKIFRWDAKPGEKGYPNVTGHPGKDIQCRCIAQPIIDL